MMDELREVLTGRLLTPDHEDWEQVRRPWNLAVDQQPLAVVEAAGPSDVEHTIAYAGAHRLLRGENQNGALVMTPRTTLHRVTRKGRGPR